MESPYFIEDDYEIILDSVLLIPKPANAMLNAKTGEYIDPTGLTTLIEYDTKYYDDFESDGEIFPLNRKVVIESENRYAINEGSFVSTSIPTSNIVTWYVDYSEDMSKVYNTLTFYVDDTIDEIPFYIYAGDYVEVNEKVNLE